MDFFAAETIAAIAIAVVAGLVRGITGFGGAMVMAPPFALLLGPQLGVPVVMLLEGVAALPMVWQTRREVSWPVIGPITLTACATVFIGGYVLASADPQIMRRVVAATVLVFSLLLLLGWRYAGRQRLATSLGLGALSGAMTGAMAVGAPPVILYLLSGPDPVNITRANLTLFLAASSSACLVALWWVGVLGMDALTLGAVLVPGYWIGLVAGTRLFAHFNDLRFRQFTLLLLVTVSAGILLA